MSGSGGSGGGRTGSESGGGGGGGDGGGGGGGGGGGDGVRGDDNLLILLQPNEIFIQVRCQTSVHVPAIGILCFSESDTKVINYDNNLLCI